MPKDSTERVPELCRNTAGHRQNYLHWANVENAYQSWGMFLDLQGWLVRRAGVVRIGVARLGVRGIWELSCARPAEG